MDTQQTGRRIGAGAGAMALALTGAMVALASWACGGGEKAGAPTMPATIVASTMAPGASERATLRGTLTLDGAPLETQFLGVRAVRGGLTAACQAAIPAVSQGRYEIPVAAEAEVRGCGAPGAELLLWAYVGDEFVFSTQTTPWPGSGAAVTFDASFSSAAPEGASMPVTEFKGLLFDRDGSNLPGGTVIEAYAGDLLCGITSLRYGDVTEGYYTLIVAGPQAVAGCGAGAGLTFRLDGKPASETAINDLEQGSDGHELNLSVQ